MEINYDYNNKLEIDEAYVSIKNSNSDINIYGLSLDCERCMYKHVTNIKENVTKLITVSTKRESIWRVYLENKSEETKSINSTPFCEVSTNFGQFGIYDFNVKEDTCRLNVVKEPTNIYIPLIGVAIAVIVLYLLISFLVKYLYKSSKNPTEALSVDEETLRKKRIKSVDTFRGIALFFMIFCNNGGGQYWFFQHSTWDGLLPADLLFPWFIWIMGLCIALSAHSPARSITKNRDVFIDILKRSVILFTIGVALCNRYPVEFKNIVVMGVLQKIAVCYFVTAVIANFFSIKKLKSIVYPKTWYSKLFYIMPQWILHISILGLHYYLTFYLQVPSCPSGYLGAGGIQDDGMYKNCTGGSAGYIDMIVLGKSHLLNYLPVSSTYNTSAFHPENLLSSLTSIFQAFLGYNAGIILKWNKKPLSRIICWIISGIICLSIGFSTSTYLHIPINKNLWSISFVFITSGIAFFMLTFCYIFNDCLQYWSGRPFISLGMNSIIVYVGNEVCYQMFPWHWTIPPMNTHLIHLIENLWSVFLWVFISIWLHKKKFYLSI